MKYKLYIKKTAAVLLALLALLTLFSCKKEENTDATTAPHISSVPPVEETTVETDMKLGYIGTDSLNPFKAETSANCAVTTLIFDSLIALNNSFEPEPLLAESFELSDNVITVSLKSGIKFSDGSALTASDVAYSFSVAKDSALYSSSLSQFSSVIYTDDFTVKFYLSSSNPYAASCLDFPIIKQDSYNEPVGSGRYKLTSFEGVLYLMLNPNYTPLRSGEAFGEDSFNVIELCEFKTNDTLSYMIRNGDIDFAFDNLSSGRISDAGTSAVPIPLNNMIFLGINSASNFTQYKNIRLAISAALDTEKLTEEVYSAFAFAADLPVNPLWYASTVTSFEDENTTHDYLERFGFGEYNEDGFATNGYYTVDLKLIVSSENELKVKLAEKIAESLVSEGINVKLVKYDFNGYISALESGEYDLYIGEIKLTSDMNLSEMFKNSAEYGMYGFGDLYEEYKSFLNSESSFEEFFGEFLSYCPFVPICFRNAAAIFSRQLCGTGSINAGDVFAEIENWYFK